MQEVTFLRVGKFNSIALNLFAPGQDFFVLGMYLVPVNRVHDEFCLLLLQLFDHSVGGVEQVTDTGPGIAAQITVLQITLIVFYFGLPVGQCRLSCPQVFIERAVVHRQPDRLLD